MKKVFLSLITIFMILSLSIVLVKANTKTSVVIEEGVQIRTDGNNGLKWVANVINHKDSNVYGFLFAQGELNEVTIDTTDVIVADWSVIGGISIEENKGTIRASWFDDEPVQELRVSGYYANGAGFEDVLVIKNVKENEGNSYE